MPALLRRSYGRIVRPRLAIQYSHRELFLGRSGIEFGGPSEIFSSKGLFPIYPLVHRLDNCTFSSQTIWQTAGGGDTGFNPDGRRRLGNQLFAEATALPFLASGTQDFVISSHMLEHCANPIKALHEWKRLLKSDGILLLVLPHKDGTFDHNRPATTLSHMLDDFAQNTDETDLSHVPEILELHDLALDPGAGDRERFRARCLSNAVNRGMHHHVFDTRAALELVMQVGFLLCAVEAALPFHIAIIACNTTATHAHDRDFLRADAEHFRRSPFPSDRPAG